MSDLTNAFSLQPDAKKLEAFGFKLAGGGAHTTRTIMLKDITHLLNSVSPSAEIDSYKKAIIDDNILGKATQATRKESFRHLRELYALSEKVPIFSIYRELMFFDPQSAPLLSLLIAWARDPVLRAMTPAIFSATYGSEVKSDSLQNNLIDTFPNAYSSYNYSKIAKYAASSWTQSGHLTGRTNKIRTRVQPGPASLKLAFLLAYVCGWTGEKIFTSPWCQMLDLNGSEAKSLASQAHREGLITLKVVGSIVDVSFPRFSQILEGLP